jgi:dihydrofolate synthase/folylpolyglutamate synthase
VDLTAALAYLDRHINREATAGRVAGLSLDPITRLMAALGDPQRAYPVIHVTGTNGKGSTVAMIVRLLVAHGLNVGAYTSPHLERINERLTRNGEPISDDELAQVISQVASIEDLAGVHPSYFEILTAAALTWFADVGVDVAVVEVGLLGRWDATNVVEAEVAVITNVGLDHTDGAPGWRERVAEEKAGIIDPRSTVVLGETEPSLRPIFERESSAGMLVRGDDFGVERNELAVGGRVVDLRAPRGTLEELFLPVHGAHQGDNAAIAVAAVDAFFERAIDAEVAEEAFGELRLPGRFEVVGRNPLVVLDGAHNPGGMQAAADALADFTVDRRLVVFGMLEGRPVDQMIAGLGLTPNDLLIACAAPNPRAVPVGEIARAAEAMGVAVDVAPDPADAVEAALSLAGEHDAVVIIGSLYVVGLARQVLAGRDDLLPDRGDVDGDDGFASDADGAYDDGFDGADDRR